MVPRGSLSESKEFQIDPPEVPGRAKNYDIPLVLRSLAEMGTHCGNPNESKLSQGISLGIQRNPNCPKRPSLGIQRSPNGRRGGPRDGQKPLYSIGFKALAEMRLTLATAMNPNGPKGISFGIQRNPNGPRGISLGIERIPNRPRGGSREGQKPLYSIGFKALGGDGGHFGNPSESKWSQGDLFGNLKESKWLQKDLFGNPKENPNGPSGVPGRAKNVDI